MPSSKVTSLPASPHASLLARVEAALDGERYSEALALVDEALAGSPGDAALHHVKGAVHVLAAEQWPVWRAGHEGDRERTLRAALAALDHAIQIAPGYAEAHLARGLTKLQLADRAGGNDDLGRALALELPPPLRIQAHNARGAEGDMEVVRTMRKIRGIGDGWRANAPQRISLWSAPAKAQTPTAQGEGAKTAKAKPKRGVATNAAPSAHPIGHAPAPASDPRALEERAKRAYKAAVRAAAAGKGGRSPEDARLDVWLEAFPAPLRPAIRVFFTPPLPADPWATACAIAGEGREHALASAIVGREHPPFVDTRHYLLHAAALFEGEPALLSKIGDDCLTQIEGMGNYRFGQELTIAQVRALVPTEVLSPKARAIAAKLAANAKYGPIAAALVSWAGITPAVEPGPPAPRRGEVAAVVTFEALIQEALATDDPKALARIHRRVEKLDLLVAGDEPALRERIDACVAALEAHTPRSTAARREVANILDAATAS